MDFNTKKRRHHFVWQYYLRAWATRGQVACRRKDGSVFVASTQNAAVMKDFYRVRELTEADIAFIDGVCIARAPEHIRGTLRNWIPLFAGLFEVRRQLAAKGLRVDGAASTELFDIAANNLEENLHEMIESKAIPHLDSLRAGRTEFLSIDEELISFCHYISVQFMRTRNRRQRMLAAFADDPPNGVNLEASWGLMSHVLATTFGYNLFAQRERMTWSIITSPDKNLVTGDQPVVNLHAVGVPDGVEVDRLALYYPLSPRRALLIEDSLGSAVRSLQISATQAEQYNLWMQDQSSEHSFALAIEDFSS